jgi:hypothetical protein
MDMNKLLGAEVLSEDVKQSLQEAFDSKIDEARQQVREEVETQIREEFARRYEHDKAELVEAMDRMLSDVITKHAEEKLAETTKLKESRDKYQAAVKESRSAYREKMKEHMGTVRKFVIEQITKEMAELRRQQNRLAEQRSQAVAQLKEAKKALAEQHADRLRKIDEFAVRQVGKELREFARDKRALVETRVKLVTESRNKLRETQKRFINESAKKVDQIVSETMKREMTQLHEDLERNRQNMFGRRIFEAVAAEFMSSYLSEGTATKKLQNIVEAKDKELAEIKQKLTEATKAAAVSKRKAMLAEESAARTKVLNELLAPLSRDKRTVMQELLETVKTPALREAFNRYLPTVISENGGKVAPQTAKKTLTEAPAAAADKRTVTITGDQRTNRLLETVQAEDGLDSETVQILRLAGIHK